MLFRLLPVGLALGALAATASAQTVDFATQIRPILEVRCYACHGPEKQKNGLRLDRQKDALAGGDSGPVIVPGKSGDSELLRRIASRDKSERMPPTGEPLAAAQVQALRLWIEQGAKWPADGTKTADRRDWWSFKPIVQPPLPPLPLPASRSPIDAFIQAKLREKGLAPSPEADRRTLIRRLSFDLIGLPPTPEEIDAFVARSRSAAYEKLVDRLLASPRYGERWARHWLDVVHYGDTHGYDKDKPRPNAWPYRDYVIRAFNDDKPYARFVQEQFAGDVLFPDTADGVEATGFIAAGPWDFIGHAEVPETKIDGKIARCLDRDDMVANTMNTFVSLTVHCARCHDHKFDPIYQEDYYRSRPCSRPSTGPTAASMPIPPWRATALPWRRSAENWRRPASSWTSVWCSRPGRNWRNWTAVSARPTSRTQRRAPPRSAITARSSRPPTNPNGCRSIWAGASKSVRWSTSAATTLSTASAPASAFPRRFKIEISSDDSCSQQWRSPRRSDARRCRNPGVTPQRIVVGGKKARYVRVTATKLADRGTTSSSPWRSCRSSTRPAGTWRPAAASRRSTPSKPRRAGARRTSWMATTMASAPISRN